MSEENRRVSFIVHWPLRKEERTEANSSCKLWKKKEERKERSSAVCPKEWSPCVILSLFQHWSKALAKCEALLWWKGTVLISVLTCSIIELWGRWGERGVHYRHTCGPIAVISCSLLGFFLQHSLSYYCFWFTHIQRQPDDWLGHSELSKENNHIILLRIWLCYHHY